MEELHFAEIDPSVTWEGQRVFDIIIYGDNLFHEIDIVKMNGDINNALVLNITVSVSGRSLTITLQLVKGSHTIISAIEFFEIVRAQNFN
uniref:Malectin domain-containing protein n=1 Tax=Lactuca sativa TaxID=4236 RepID=A0A9R1WR98_LACSA|nr:hypothetical protein LSAT_V11C900466860 [Lactuca sativa]